MVEKYPDRVAAVEWARSVGGGRRLVGGDWIFTDQQLDRLHSDYDALAARLADMTADRDMARRSLEELQQRWTENRPAAEYKARLAEAERALRGCVEHMEWSTPQGRAAYEAARAASTVDAAKEPT